MQGHAVTGNVAVTTTPAVIDTIAGAGPGQLVVCEVPNVTGVSAAASITVNIVRTDTGATIGSAVATNSGAGASPVGPIVATALVPVGIAGAINTQIVASAGTGTAVASATAPIITAILP